MADDPAAPGPAANPAPPAAATPTVLADPEAQAINGLLPVATPLAPTVDIVAVHGLNGGRWSTWTHKNGKNWLRDFLPDHLKTARIMTFGYDSKAVLNYNVDGIRGHARNFLSRLRDKREGDDDQATKALERRPIVFLCHSLGGIVVKRALRFAENEEEFKSLGKATHGIVFFGTPNRGSDLAWWGNIAAKIGKLAFLSPSSELLKDLKTNSRTLRDTTEDFLSIVKRYKIVSYYESDKLGIHKIVVDKSSAVMEIPDEEVSSLEGTHMEMCKFEADDERFEPVWKAIRRVVNYQPTRFTEAEMRLYQNLKSHSDFSRTDHFKAFEDRLPGTCTWISTHPSYTKWTAPQGPTILHVFGQYASGKGTLSRYIWDLPRPKSTICGYFSCLQEGNARPKKVTQVYAALTAQIIDQTRNLTPRLIAYLLEKVGDREVLIETDYLLAFESCLELLGDRSILLVVDRFDNCRAGKKDLVNTLMQINLKATHARIVLTSLPDTIPAETTFGANILQLDLDNEPRLQDDVKIMIKHEVKRLAEERELPASIEREIAGALEAKAEGGFLLVKGIINDLRSLDNNSKRQIRGVLRAFPETLWAWYAQKLEDVSDRSRDRARKVLALLVYSLESMTITAFAVAMAVCDDVETLEDLAEDVSLSPVQDLQRIFGVLIRQDRGFIKAHHPAFKDFLLALTDPGVQQRQKWATRSGKTKVDDPPTTALWYSMPRQQGHEEIASVCLEYLELAFNRIPPMQADHSVGEDSSLEAGSDQFLRYATDNLDGHCRAISDVPDHFQTRIVAFFQSPVASFWTKAYWSVRDPERLEENLSPLHMVCLLGLKTIATRLIDGGWDVNMKVMRHGSDGRYRTPLDTAVEGGDIGVVEMLLDRRALLTTRLEKNRTPMSTAAWYGHNNVIDLLADRGMDVFAKENNELTALDAAVAAGRILTVEHLLSLAKPRATHPTGFIGFHFARSDQGSVLFTAVRSGRPSMVQYLLGKGLNVEQFHNGETPFHVAASYGRVQILKLCRPSNIDVRTRAKFTALLLAVKRHQWEAVDFLIENGADVKAKTGAGETALHLAAGVMISSEIGQPLLAEKLRLFLGQGLDGLERASNAARETPLEYALPIDNATALEFFLPYLRSDDKEQEFQSWGRVYFAAIEAGASRCLELILAKRRNIVNVKRSPGQTGLHMISKWGDASWLRMFLKRGAKVDQQDHNGWTALCHVLSCTLLPLSDVKECVTMLLEEFHANPNIPTTGSTPLKLSLARYREDKKYVAFTTEAYIPHPLQQAVDIVQFLIENGATAKLDDFICPSQDGKLSLNHALFELLARKLEPLTTEYSNNDAFRRQTVIEGWKWALKADNQNVIAKPEENVSVELIQELFTEMLVQGDFYGVKEAAKIMDHSQFEPNRAFRGRYSIEEAVRKGNVFLVTELLKRGADPRLHEAGAQTPLWFAVCDQNDQIARALIGLGAYPEPGPDEEELKSLTQMYRTEDWLRDIVADVRGRTGIASQSNHQSIQTRATSVRTAILEAIPGSLGVASFR